MIPKLISLLATILSASAASIPSLFHSAVLPRAPSGAPTAKTVNGSYYGVYSAPYNQDLFLGIPFAKPPISNLRFANPEHLDFAWEGDLPATGYAFVSTERVKDGKKVSLK
jgi:hypothetical protein